MLAAVAEVAPGPRVAVSMAAAGLLVIECEQPGRRQRRGKGESGPIDAHLAVLAALRLDVARLPALRADGDREALRILLVARQEITVARTAQASREQAVRQAEIARPALALIQVRRQLKDNRAQLLAIVDDLAPG